MWQWLVHQVLLGLLAPAGFALEFGEVDDEVGFAFEISEVDGLLGFALELGEVPHAVVLLGFALEVCTINNLRRCGQADKRQK